MTATPSPSEPETEPLPTGDPEGAAAELLNRDAEPAPGSSTERVRRYRERKKAAAASEETGDVLTVDDDEIAESAAMASALWDLMLVPAAGGRLKPLTEPQEQRLGKAFAPLVKRYLPLLGRWQYEIAAGLALGAVIKEAWRKPDELAAWQAEREAERSGRAA